MQPRLAAEPRRGRGFERGKCNANRGVGAADRPRRAEPQGRLEQARVLPAALGPAEGPPWPPSPPPQLLQQAAGSPGHLQNKMTVSRGPGLPSNLLVIWRGGNFLSRACQRERFSKFPRRGSLRFYIMTSACRALSAPPPSCPPSAPPRPLPRHPSLGQSATLWTPRAGWSFRLPVPACALLDPPPAPRGPSVGQRGGGAAVGGRSPTCPPGPAPARAGGGVMSRQGGGAGAAGRQEAGEVFSSFKKAGGRARPCVRARLGDFGVAGGIRRPGAGTRARAHTSEPHRPARVPGHSLSRHARTRPSMPLPPGARR